jgi:hypothetical protein
MTILFFREGLAALIGNEEDIELVAEACNGHEALEQFREYRSDSHWWIAFRNKPFNRYARAAGLSA